jgi:hypothetical protein
MVNPQTTTVCRTLRAWRRGNTPRGDFATAGYAGPPAGQGTTPTWEHPKDFRLMWFGIQDERKESTSPFLPLMSLVTKNLLSRAPFALNGTLSWWSRLHLQSLVVSIHQSTLGPRGYSSLTLWLIYKGLWFSSGDMNRLMLMFKFKVYILLC